jgi:hypothetical protein
VNDSPVQFEAGADEATVRKGKDAGIVQVHIGETPAGEMPKHAGMGILVDPRHVVTCAHVINTALGRDENDAKAACTRPATTDPVALSFPMLDDRPTISGRVVAWRCPGFQQQGDIAILRLDRAAPAATGIAAPTIVAGMPIDNDDLSVFGIVEGDWLGNHIDARFKGFTSAGWAQLDGEGGNKPFVDRGFSGAAVWDYQQDAVLGMMVARLTGDAKIAYMIPIASLLSFWKSLRVERRSLSATFTRNWTLLAAAFFFFVFAHWLVNRGVGVLSFATLYGTHKPLAAFWGMHIHAFVAPFVLGMLCVFAHSFRLHDWHARVPSFGISRGRPISSGTKGGAALVLVALVLLPFTAQIHFLRVFHNEGHVYIYPSSFGFKAEELNKAGWTCDKRSVHLCTQRNTDRYTLMKPKEGTKASHWSNDYHYGDRDGANGKSSTYYPIVQPVVIIALTAINGLLSLLASYLVFRRPANQTAAPPAVPNE